MENYNSSIKSTYLALFILGIIEVIFTIFLGFLVGIAVFIVALILRSKLAEIGEATTRGIKLMILGSSLHILTFIIWMFGKIAFLLYLTHVFSFFALIINVFIFIAIFIILIIGCILIYQEYDAIKVV
jgi:hypothetical protein